MRRRPLRVLLVALLALVGGAAVVDRLAPSRPGGPPSSSYATQPRGLAAYHDVLERSGRRVRRLRIAPSERPVPRAETLVVLDPRGLADADAAALVAFVERGGRLVAGGAAGGDWLRRLLGDAVRGPARASLTARPLAAARELAGVATVQAPDARAFTDSGRGLPVLATAAGDALAVVVERGAGRAYVLADAAPLQNRALAAADNAAFGLALAGSRPVAFLETVHGFGRPTGLAALPPRWQAALAGLALAVLLLLLARGRRIGAPSEPEVAWPPPRAAYVDALAAALEKTGRPGEVAEPVRAAARDRIARRAQLGPAPEPAALAAAAERLGLPPAERAALTGGDDEQALLHAARALARTEART